MHLIWRKWLAKMAASAASKAGWRRRNGGPWRNAESVGASIGANQRGGVISAIGFSWRKSTWLKMKS
jgi:hypothetical protein